ncbi:SDR family NAD(P)-dependent oxidoreductase [Autumnicola edwardsiae]|uniref:SDR family oxidoreductase n=1 Tax=Autumnicola edwardsiae TaxID=3075594 RepID=A0ABU3CYU0_9FLAO|nr:SDR family oxidoreductase [Zunongwangia sp. F297]MDT0651546.1 SDR family oxidoreductase [Zunongwangia sp. F297]
MESNEKKTVLITGATSGIGKALAHKFAGNGYDIIAVSRNEDELNKITSEIQNQYGVEVFSIKKDLAQDGAAKEVYSEVKQTKRTVNILVNDAGVGQRGNFVDIPTEKDSEIIHLNVLALAQLTKLYAKEMVERDEGRILNLGSIAGFQPGPMMAIYHATKAFVVSFSEALATELKDMKSAVTVTCLCPGPTDTNFFSRADMENTNVVANKDKLMESPHKVAEEGYEALMKGERIHIPGASNKVMTFTRRVIPKSLQAKIQKKFYETHEE